MNIVHSLNDSPPLVFIAELPGPRTGQTLVNEEMLSLFRRDLTVRVLNTGGRIGTIPTVFTRVMHWIKYIRVGIAVTYWRLGGSHTLYTSLHSTSGLWLDLALVLLARALGYRCILHHHTYPYVTARDWRMALIHRRIGPSGVNVVPCQQFREAYAKQYTEPTQFSIVNPSVVCQNSDQTQRTLHETFTLGHLSNLSISKGLPLVLKTFSQLVDRNASTRLILAGPCHSHEEQNVIEAAIRKHGNKIKWIGPVYGSEKRDFHRSIDLFLFPTQYSKEVWGIVLTEAMMQGIPCIAYGRACIPSIIGDDAGLVIDPKDDFASVATPFIEYLIKNPEDYDACCAAAKSRGIRLSEEAEDGVAKLIDQILKFE